MANLMHIAETAVLLFVAYQVGWFVAFIARRLLSAQSKPAAVAAERLAKAKGELAEAAAVTATPAAPAPASVLATTPLADPPPVPAPAAAPAAAEAAPVAPPRPRPPLTPVAAAPTPPPAVPTLAETAPEASFLNVLEADDDEPPVAPPKLPDAPVGGEDALAAVRDAIGISVVASPPQAVELAEPVVPPPAPYETPVQVDKASPEQPSAVYEAAGVVPEDDVIAIDAPVEVQAEPVAAPSEDAFPAAPEPIVPVATEDVEFVLQADPGRPPEAAIVEADAEPEPPPPRQLKPASRPGEAWSGRPVSSSPAILASPVETALDSPALAAAPATAAVAAATAEAEAMRAIEGGWTRRPSTRPAEAAARSGPGPVAQAAPTRPPALLEPREGGKDDLRLIEGLRPADEAALNALGIFHFDQIAQWNRPAIDWLELHQIGAGRVTGERWVEQAQMLTSIANSARAVGS